MVIYVTKKQLAQLSSKVDSLIRRLQRVKTQLQTGNYFGRSLESKTIDDSIRFFAEFKDYLEKIQEKDAKEVLARNTYYQDSLNRLLGSIEGDVFQKYVQRLLEEMKEKIREDKYDKYFKFIEERFENFLLFLRELKTFLHTFQESGWNVKKYYKDLMKFIKNYNLILRTFVRTIRKFSENHYKVVEPVRKAKIELNELMERVGYRKGHPKTTRDRDTAYLADYTNPLVGKSKYDLFDSTIPNKRSYVIALRRKKFSELQSKKLLTKTEEFNKLNEEVFKPGSGFGEVEISQIKEEYELSKFKREMLEKIREAYNKDDQKKMELLCKEVERRGFSPFKNQSRTMGTNSGITAYAGVDEREHVAHGSWAKDGDEAPKLDRKYYVKRIIKIMKTGYRPSTRYAWSLLGCEEWKNVFFYHRPHLAYGGEFVLISWNTDEFCVFGGPGGESWIYTKKTIPPSKLTLYVTDRRLTQFFDRANIKYVDWTKKPSSEFLTFAKLREETRK